MVKTFCLKKNQPTEKSGYGYFIWKFGLYGRESYRSVKILTCQQNIDRSILACRDHIEQ